MKIRKYQNFSVNFLDIFGIFIINPSQGYTRGR